jgi:polyisoprenyl-teichoic acid--peptidoglycan teichoic acid transferase
MWKRFAMAAAVIVVLSAAATATAGLLQVDELRKKINLSPALSAEVDEALTRADVGGPRTFLLIGSDKRYVFKKTGEPPRSDTMMLVRLDPDKAATTLLSIPRDLKVGIPGHGERKVNEAFSLGGSKLVVETLTHLLDIPINHVVNVRFDAFAQGVNQLGCIYVDVDQRYFNDNTQAGEKYAAIDIQPGYQRLCGQDSLAYVRYRHTDSDLVRNARQQDFLRQAKQQIATSRLIGDREALLEIFGKSTQTDRKLHKTKTLFSVLKLAIFSAGHPIREVRIQNLEEEPGTTNLVASHASIARAAREFMGGRSSAGPRAEVKESAQERKAKRKRKRFKASSVPGLEQAATVGENLAIPVATKIPFPVYYPTLRPTFSVYPKVGPRVYSLRDRGGKLHRAYRLWVQNGVAGEYWGLQGTDWTKPPILENPTGTRRCSGSGGRKVSLYTDGSRYRLVAWRSRKAVYWISNTLAQSLSRRQMLALACTAKRTK